jgi:hypothetical protein
MILEIALWIVQIALAAFYVFAGYVKIARPIPEIVRMFPWPGEVPPWFVRFTGVVDALGGIGVILPQLVGVLPWLTPIAAAGLLLLQVLAIIFHARRGETGDTIILNIILLVAAGFVLWGRWSLFGA